MAEAAQPLNKNFPIIDPQTGAPTEYFIRWAQQFSGNAATGSDLETIQNEIDNLSLDSLTDVDVSTNPPSNNQVLGYDSGSSLWVPKTSSGGGGWTPTAPVAADFSIVRNYSGIGAPSIVDAMRSEGIIATFPRNTTGSSWEQSYLFKTAPVATSWRFECLMYNMSQTNDNYWFNGIGVGSTAVAGRHIAIQTYLNGSTDVRYGRGLTYPSLNSNTSGDVVLDEGPGDFATTSPPVWYALEYDTSGPTPVLNLLWSLDGYGWVQAYHVDDPATWIGGPVDLIGFAHMSVSTSGGDNTIRCAHFKETTNLSDPLGLNT